jgi:phage tail-like protein
MLVPTAGHVDWRGDWLVRQLPVGMAQDQLLVRFVTLFQQLANGLLDHLDGMTHLGDVTVTPEAMVRYLGSWIGVEWVDPMLDPRQQRELVRSYCRELMWRGTRRGLRQLLATITGDPDPVVTDSGGIFLYGEAPGTAPHVHLEVAGLGTWVTENDLLAIVRSELPASVTFELVVGGRLVEQAAGPTR